MNVSSGQHRVRGYTDSKRFNKSLNELSLASAGRRKTSAAARVYVSGGGVCPKEIEFVRRSQIVFRAERFRKRYNKIDAF